MLFINPMWDNEAERIGKQKCTRVGYALHVVSDLLGFFALLLLFGVAAHLGYCAVIGAFNLGLLWLIAFPVGLAIIGAVLYRASWTLARRKGFQYDSAGREASWIENGQRCTYKSPGS